MNKHSELIDCYLNWYRTQKEEYWWAWEEVDIKRNPDDLPFIFQLIQACQNDEEIAYVAAGPLHDLFRTHHLAIKSALDIMVRGDMNMRKAIQALIFAEGSSERKTLNEILNKYGLHYASL
ncbi:DUF6869 domain-containing protein [Legionella spiritensis]|uniref:DUF6869 domain-containing protein n=1 Tax=Legionella spiritensis TaxID=452 RepID=A0A0W0YYB9_LEGSP|nr:hypothetical protein [Legionella spiritensis]KTD61881.1 hypothetical protein Lspi_2511 [Legionella spiritensis]SNV45445.1 Uncharacterised protein [Legionella spiritensis]